MIWQITLILSLIQGITEFIPVSSSGHLVLLPYFLDTPYQGRAFDVYIHWKPACSPYLLKDRNYFNGKRFIIY